MKKYEIETVWEFGYNYYVIHDTETNSYFHHFDYMWNPVFQDCISAECLFIDDVDAEKTIESIINGTRNESICEYKRF